jgi:protoheme ferro-lyase
MAYLNWLLLVIFSFGLGVFFLKYLTVHPLRMSFYLVLTCVAAFVVLVLLATGFTWSQLPGAIVLLIIVFLAGYGIMTRALLSREDSRPVPELARAKGDPGDGHIAVIYFTHGEPQTYDPIGWINQFKEFDEQGIPFIPYLIRPFFIYQLRNKYLQVGTSHHRQVHHEMMKSLEQTFKQAGDTTTKFYISFLDDNPRPDAAVIQALNEGASHIIVSEVFLTISNHTAEGKELVEALKVEDFGATLHFTGPLWDSETLRSMFVSRANEHLNGTAKSKVGVLLVGHGQPDEWDVEWPTETDQELGFREEILKLFEADGYKPENLSLAWMEFKEPKPAPKVEEFWKKNGVERVIFFSAAISADSIHSQYDIPELVRQADVPKELPIIDLGAWNNDPVVIQSIKEKIDAAIDGFNGSPPN